ncbi:MAG: AI-2E family transporter [Bergeyella sp.]|nr:AI-2E family transporter [Bergeyella sp.]
MINNNKESQISTNVIKQVFLIGIILSLLGLICWSLSGFLSSFLGAFTLYVVCRKPNFYLQEERKWPPTLASLFIIIICLLVLILPIFFMVNLLISKLGNPSEYLTGFHRFLMKIQHFVQEKFNIDLLSRGNIDKLQSYVATYSSSVLSSTLNIITLVSCMFFVLYFMLVRSRMFERALAHSLPLKKTNVNLIGEKFRRLIYANAVGIPIVAAGQGFVALVGYTIFGAPNLLLLFCLTTITSMIPIVGSAIVYIPVSIYMIAEGSVNGGIMMLIYCFVLVGMTDNILRFTVLRKLENIHPLNSVFGIIMGLKLFGFMGLVFGPIITSITLLLIQVYKNEFTAGSDDLKKTM